MALAVVVAALLAVAPVGTATMPTARSGVTAILPLYKNCTALNKKYPHGLGKRYARDKTSGVPVTTFKRSSKLYNLAMSYNKRLDADKDGIACEKK